MSVVVKAASFGPPVAYCYAACDWIKGPPTGEPNPPGFVHRAAEQHARDTGHTTQVAVPHLTTYTPEGATHA